ncbi:MAG: 50S ribosomal protein L10 [Parcubacteria group bacterium]|nr:50S ribosomal protein L10 [Parcubacteria group bacterium]|tara:strand:- start:36 stop:557 length:522 start_codon:yes stop_codon:yes gene_type:complete
MAKTKEQKQQIMDKLTDRLKSGKGVVFATFAGVPMAGTEALRKTCREAGIYYTVPKKTLADLALKEAGIEMESVRKIEGNFSVAVADDEVAAAQALAAFAKEYEGFQIVGGVLEKKYIEKSEVVALSKLPNKQELLGKLVGTLQAPISGFARVLQANISGLVRTLHAIKESKA